jgi:hypothetical protein
MKYLIIEMYFSMQEDPALFDEFIHKLKTEEYDVFIFYAPSEWEYWYNVQSKNLWNTIVETIYKRNKKIEVITGAAKVLQGEPKLDRVTVHPWDTYWITASYFNLKDHVREIKPYTYKYIYMNNNDHVWRCKLMDLVAKNNLINHGAVSWHKLRCDYPWQYFKPEILKLTDSFSDCFNAFTLPEEYDSSFMQLISESTINALFITEKTAKPLFTGKPFLVASVQGYHAHLKKLGFELYTEIFDYSFDDEIDEDIRYEKLLTNLTKICNYSEEQLASAYQQIEEKLLFNQKRAKEIAIKHINKPDILNNFTEILWHYDLNLYNKYMFIAV